MQMWKVSAFAAVVSDEIVVESTYRINTRDSNPANTWLLVRCLTTKPLGPRQLHIAALCGDLSRIPISLRISVGTILGCPARADQLTIDRIRNLVHAWMQPSFVQLVRRTNPYRTVSRVTKRLHEVLAKEVLHGLRWLYCNWPSTWLIPNQLLLLNFHSPVVVQYNIANPLPTCLWSSLSSL